MALNGLPALRGPGFCVKKDVFKHPPNEVAGRGYTNR